jgi:3-oxo-5alpha-steroid 4-dehydrogenase
MMFQKEGAASYVEQPLTIGSTAELNWEQETDVVVVGYGGAGLCAALEAKANGADVIALDRFVVGGATALSGGIIYSGGTPYQKQAGINDSPEEMYKYLYKEIGDAVRPETLQRFCDSGAANLEWLTSHGVGFGSNAYLGKRTYPPKGYDIYYSGNEAAPNYAPVAAAAPRGHRVAGKGYTGQDLCDALSVSAAKQGVKVETHTKVVRLVTDANGRVVGVEAQRIPVATDAFAKHEKIIKKVNAFDRYIESKALKAADTLREIEDNNAERFYVRARQAVIIATGSFSFNRKMVKHYAPKYGESMPLGTIGCDGSGVVLGQSVGASVGHMDSVTAWRTISPPESFVKAIVVNKAGERFIAEDVYLGHLGRAIANQDDQRAWLIIDAKTYWSAYNEVLPRWGEEGYMEFRGPICLNLLFNSKRGKTLAALAEKIGVDAAGLKRQVAMYNQGVAANHDQYDKKPSNLKALKEGTYWAIDVSIGSKRNLCASIPMGGLCVDEDSGQVLDSSEQAIEGLYAAGRAAVGIPSGFYVSGSSIADCVFSGRRAGHHAANTAARSI